MERNTLIAFAAGLTFALGLGISGMTRPDKVVNFLDLTGNWDPSLAFVMIGAIAVHFVAYRMVPRMGSPLFSERFGIPTRRDIDPRLVVGSAMFGIGWGLGGFCPGPALVSIIGGASSTLLFVGAMLAGMGLFEVFNRKVLQPIEARRYKAAK